jgi:hypothetical protein
VRFPRPARHAILTRPALAGLALLTLSLPACQKEPQPTPEAAVEVIRSHYRAINDRRFKEAYDNWEGKGKASGKTFVAFLNGYAQTDKVEVTPGPPSRIEGAAGSRFIMVPVRIVSRKHDGTEEEFAGTYTLRFSVVEGAKPEQRSWHIYSAKIEPVGNGDSLSKADSLS